MPAARAAARTGANASSDSAIVMRMLACAKASEAAVNTATASAPAAMARSMPRMFGTSTG